MSSFSLRLTHKIAAIGVVGVVGVILAAELVRRILSERDNPSTRWGGLAEVREA